ncbi:uncharacterized protein [Antedon mediterranea]|uniref:uncharacterized protein n=1 Tax=Antedon mediterranea TaxID=105859 RepID=UPI003AF58FBD
MNALFLLVILATAYGERGDLRLTSGSENHGLIQISETDKWFRSGCFNDSTFGDTEALIVCRQLDFQYFNNYWNSVENPLYRVAVVQDFSCTEDNVKLIDCMQLEFFNTTQLEEEGGFVCNSVLLACSHTAPPPKTTTFAPKSTSVGNGIRGKVEQHNDSSAVTRSSMVIVLLMVIAAVVFNNQDD